MSDEKVTPIEVNLPEGDGFPAAWDESMQYDPMELLTVRNLVEEALMQHTSFKFDGSAGVGVDGADLDVMIDGERYNINIKPRKSHG